MRMNANEIRTKPNDLRTKCEWKMSITDNIFTLFAYLQYMIKIANEPRTSNSPDTTVSFRVSDRTVSGTRPGHLGYLTYSSQVPDFSFSGTWLYGLGYLASFLWLGGTAQNLPAYRMLPRMASQLIRYINSWICTLLRDRTIWYNDYDIIISKRRIGIKWRSQVREIASF